MEVLYFAVLLCVVYILVFYFHEAGHYYAAKLVKCKIVEMNFTTIGLLIPVPNSVFIDDEEVEKSKPKTFFHLIGGVIVGLIPILALYAVSDVDEKTIMLLFTASYLLQGCSSDFMQIIRLLSGKELL
ncbi:MAG: hypothetical protein WC102_01725 [Saccharofermentanales bacterium]